MPTNPPSNLYDPDAAVAATESLTRVACPVLREIVAQGAAIFARCATEVEHRSEGGPNDEHLAVFIQYHHLLEMLDAVNEALCAGRVVGSRPPLRSAFEALLGIEYILKDAFEQRAFAFLVGNVMKKLAYCDLLTPGTEARVELDKALAEDLWSDTHALAEIANVDEVRASLVAALELPKWKEAAHAWRTTETARRGRKRRIHWYQLYGGPITVRQLAREVGRAYQYELLYGPLSETIHVGDSDRIFGSRTGVPGFTCIPDFRYIETAFSFAFAIGVSANRQILHRYRDESTWFAKWYLEEVQPVYRTITGHDFREI